MISIRETNEEIDRTAAAWFTRLDRGALSDADHAAFEQWYDASPLHRGAFAKVEAIFVLVDDADVMADVTPAIAAPPTLHQPIARRAIISRRSALWFTAGALAVFAVFKANTLPTFHTETYQTARGEVRAIPLSDGSTLTLNTSSQVEVRFRDNVREVQLNRGEALFDVAKDKTRPFLVTAGSTTVRAVGTSFLVRNLDKQPVEVLVREGAVDMFRTNAENAGVRVSANAKAVALDVPQPSVKLVNVQIDPSVIAKELAWCSGMIAFEDESLRSAATKFSRYSDMHIVIDDPDVASQTVTGIFSIHDPEGFARSVALSLDLHIEVMQGSVMLWR